MSLDQRDGTNDQRSADDLAQAKALLEAYPRASRCHHWLKRRYDSHQPRVDESDRLDFEEEGNDRPQDHQPTELSEEQRRGGRNDNRKRHQEDHGREGEPVGRDREGGQEAAEIAGEEDVGGKGDGGDDRRDQPDGIEASALGPSDEAHADEGHHCGQPGRGRHRAPFDEPLPGEHQHWACELNGHTRSDSEPGDGDEEGNRHRGEDEAEHEEVEELAATLAGATPQGNRSEHQRGEDRPDLGDVAWRKRPYQVGGHRAIDPEENRGEQGVGDAPPSGAYGVGDGSGHNGNVAGLAYFVGPEVPGPNVLLLHSWHGLNGSTRRLADRLAEEGFTVLAPDLLDEARPETHAEAEATLAAADPNELVAATLGGLGVLSRTHLGPIRVLGLGMGGSLGLWLSARRPEQVVAVASFYGAQSIDFEGAAARYQLHLADDDPWVTSDDAAFTEATIGLSGQSVESFVYPGTRPGFFEAGDEHDEAAAALAWSRVIPFLGMP